MQKILIASDIHGSAYWCEKLVQAFEKENADTLLLLGDLLYHGPRNPLPDGYAPMEVVKILSSLKEKIVCVRGNCDSEVDQMVLPFPIMADYAILNVDGQKIFATHGHLFSDTNPPLLEKGDILVNGHFHTPMDIMLDGGSRYANCGSVALPKEGTPHSYMVYENGELTWKEL
jgi:putative phosphoesterase